MYASLITAPITVGFGGSAGLQGPAVSTGAALGSYVSQLFHMNAKTRMLLIGCATAGAMSSMFKAPVAAIIFAVEIFSLDLAFASLVPLLLASVSAVITSYFFFEKDALFGFKLIDAFQTKDIFYYIILGFGTGVASVYFSKIYFKITKFFKFFKKPMHRLIIGGFAIGLLLYLIPPLYGEGYGFINNLLNGNSTAALADIPYKVDLTNIWVGRRVPEVCGAGRDLVEDVESVEPLARRVDLANLILVDGSGADTFAASCPMGSDEVLDAIRHSASTAASTAAKILDLRSIFSGTASITTLAPVTAWARSVCRSSVRPTMY